MSRRFNRRRTKGICEIMKIRELFEDVTIKSGDIEVSTKEQNLLSSRRSAGWGDVVKGDFRVDEGDNLKSLDGCPKIVEGSFICYDKKNLSDISNCPEEVGVNVTLWGCNLTSYEGLPKKIGTRNFVLSWLNLHDNPITSLKGIGHYYSGGQCGKSIKLPLSIKSNILGLLQINKLERVFIESNGQTANPDLYSACEIVTKYLQGSRDILDCQEELIDAGLKDFAKL